MPTLKDFTSHHRAYVIPGGEIFIAGGMLFVGLSRKFAIDFRIGTFHRFALWAHNGSFPLPRIRCGLKPPFPRKFTKSFAEE
jgi:hypothetical protein